jgi:hypothetical protein
MANARRPTRKNAWLTEGLEADFGSMLVMGSKQTNPGAVWEIRRFSKVIHLDRDQPRPARLQL